MKISTKLYCHFSRGVEIDVKFKQPAEIPDQTAHYQNLASELSLHFPIINMSHCKATSGTRARIFYVVHIQDNGCIFQMKQKNLY